MVAICDQENSTQNIFITLRKRSCNFSLVEKMSIYFISGMFKLKFTPKQNNIFDKPFPATLLSWLFLKDFLFYNFLCLVVVSHKVSLAIRVPSSIFSTQVSWALQETIMCQLIQRFTLSFPPSMYVFVKSHLR